MKTLNHLEFFQMFINIQKSLFFEIVLCVCRFVTNVCPKTARSFQDFQNSRVLCSLLKFYCVFADHDKKKISKTARCFQSFTHSRILLC